MERNFIAYHEAGHAVVARKLGIEIADLTMVAAAGYVANVKTRTAAWANGNAAHGFYADLMVALAGVAAQKLAGYSEELGNHDGDLQNVTSCAGAMACIEAGVPVPDELEPNNPLHAAGLVIIERAWDETTTLLMNNWPTVERVARALNKRNRLTQAHLDRIITQKEQGGSK